MLVGLDVLPLYKLSFYVQEWKKVISPRPVSFQEVSKLVFYAQ